MHAWVENMRKEAPQIEIVEDGNCSLQYINTQGGVHL